MALEVQSGLACNHTDGLGSQMLLSASRMAVCGLAVLEWVPVAQRWFYRLKSHSGACALNCLPDASEDSATCDVVMISALDGTKAGLWIRCGFVVGWKEASKQAHLGFVILVESLRLRTKSGFAKKSKIHMLKKLMKHLGNTALTENVASGIFLNFFKLLKLKRFQFECV